MKLAVMMPMVALAAAVGCAGAGAQQGSGGAPAPVRRPLASLATRRILVLPTHFLRPGDSLGFASQITDPGEYLGEVDAEIAFALGNRGLKDRWVFPERLAEAARRNPTYAPDIHALAAQWLRPPLRRVPEQFPEPFASEVRTLIALEDNSQYLLFPVEIRFEPAGAGAERAVLTVVLLDARRSKIVWMGDVMGDASTHFTPALAASAAEHLADLIAAP
ncbi:MAG TPA: hypothetical protein VF041_07890 [Gemmatimonadaceae bacterium]